MALHNYRSDMNSDGNASREGKALLAAFLVLEPTELRVGIRDPDRLHRATWPAPLLHSVL